MAVWTLFFSSILLPLITIALLGRRPRKPRAGWIATFFMAAGMCGFAFFAAPWGWFGMAVRWLIAVLFLTAVIFSLRRDAEASADESPLRMVVKVLIGFLFGSVAFGVVRGHQVPPNPIDLTFPLRDGRFLVVHGGSTSASNVHFADPKQRYAVDLVKTNAFGFRASGIYPADLTRYSIYGASVVSPCNGSVLRVVDGLPDQPRGVMDTKNPLGNHIVIRCGDADVTLGQLQARTITTKQGATVVAGAPIAKAGNSGSTTEPHLHIHAERNGVAAPMTFEGRWLVRNAVVK
ncbi:MAG TPA: M23 family metallopeptidase [Thermoanaerobaculia bacterium]